MEFWDLLNKNGKRTGEIIRRGEPIPPDRYHLVVSAWIVNSEDQYLLSQRHPEKAYPLFWECTGGSVLAGEESVDGAVREVMEELGITLNAEQGIHLFRQHRKQTQDFYDVWVFHADIALEQITLQASEVVDVKWANKDQMIEMYHSGCLHPLIDYIKRLP